MNGPGSDPGARRRGSGGSPPPVGRIQWIAFLLSPVIYGFVGYMVMRGHTPSGAVPPLPFFVVGILLTLAAIFAPRFIPRRESTAAGMATPTQIISWAFDESVSIVGFAGVFLGSFPVTTFVLFAVVSMGLIWLHRPGD